MVEPSGFGRGCGPWRHDDTLVERGIGGDPKRRVGDRRPVSEGAREGPMR